MKLEIPNELRTRIKRELAKAGRVEIGGILMAEQLSPGDFRLADFTVDSQKGTAAHFVRSVEEHQSALSDFFERTGHDYSRFNYLGEWHSHPNHLPLPSHEDIYSMESLIHSERGIPFAVLMIVRKKWFRLSMSVTLFAQNTPPQPIEIR